MQLTPSVSGMWRNPCLDFCGITAFPRERWAIIIAVMSEISQIDLVNQPVDWPSHNPERVTVPRPPIVLGLAVGLLVVTFLCSGLWFHSEISSLRQVRDAAQSSDRAAGLQLLATLFATGSGLILLGFLVVGRRRVLERAEKSRTEWQGERGEMRMVVKELRSQLAHRHKVVAQLEGQQSDMQEKISALTRACDEAQSELKQIRLAEQVFTHKQRELVRSKGVLELNVQARAQQLQKLQRAYELILNSAGEGICGLDLNGNITFINPAAAKMAGVDVVQLAGKQAREVFPEFMGNLLVAPGSEAGGKPVEVMVARRDGTSFGAEFVRTPIREGERVVGEVVLFKDITERKHASETLARKAVELARSNAELEQFAFVASHDLQEPLRKIQAFGDRLKTKCAAVNLDEGRDYLDRMQSAAARMQTLIYDLLTFSRVISRTEPFVPVDLKIVAGEVLSDLEVRIEKCKGRVEVGDLPMIEADALQMRQLLQNLIGNALKFHAPGTAPLVRVQARLFIPTPPAGVTPAIVPKSDPAAEVQFCELTVTDNGIGFDEKYLDRIFAVFQRLHGRQEYEGTGIGLAVCRRIVDRHGGTITARSKPGEGATFIITLPLRPVTETKGVS